MHYTQDSIPKHTFLNHKYFEEQNEHDFELMTLYGRQTDGQTCTYYAFITSVQPDKKILTSGIDESITPAEEIVIECVQLNARFLTQEFPLYDNLIGLGLTLFGHTFGMRKLY